MGLLSVIVPVYKAEQYLAQCIESILAQTVRDLELILVDDGSPDGSGEICDHYADCYPNIKVVHQKNGGQIAARKAGLRLADGKYVAFVDSDDWIDPDMYQLMIEQAEKHQAEIVTCGLVREYTGRTERYHDAMSAGVYEGKRLDTLKENAIFCIDKMEQGIAPSVCTKLFLKDAVMESFLSRTERIPFGEDGLFTYSVLFQSHCVVVNNEHCPYHYRMVDSSVTHTFDQNYFANLRILYHKFRDVISADPEELVEKSMAYNYVFLFLNGINLVMGRGNNVSYWAKYLMVKEQLDDPLLQQSLALVELDRFPGHTATQITLLARRKPGVFVVHYLLHAVIGRLSALVKR